MSRELAAAAEESLPEENGFVEARAKEARGRDDPKRFPRQSHVARYTEARTWTVAYDGVRAGRAAWPKPADGAGLRGMLATEDPALRGMAAEALATLHEPEDLPLLGGLLGDTAESSPMLGYNVMWHADYPPFSRKDTQADKLILMRGWQPRTVAAYARDALKLATALEFADEAAFLKWWENHAPARHCLWYWQQRLQREMGEVEHHARINGWVADYHEQVAEAKAAIARSVLAELMQMPPEVEAKVRLLTHSMVAGGAPITGTEDSFWPEPPSLRVDAERLLALLDRKDLWVDVEWDSKHYNLLAERLGMWADLLFLPEHAARLRQALERERDILWWSGKAALIIGIAHLLPAAEVNELDDSDTRDGTLRNAALHESDLFTRSYCAMELVRVGLPDNAHFVKSIAFQPIKGNDRGHSPSLSQAILQALAEKPLTAKKRSLLCDMVLDERFRIFWTRYNAQMGDDMDREYAIRAINAHAGNEMITSAQKYALVDPTRSADALSEVYASVEKLRAIK